MSTRKIVEIKSDNNKMKKMVEVIFNNIDKDNSGQIQREEFAKFITILCDDIGIENLNPEENELLFRHLDKDNSGNLSQEEILEWVGKLFENLLKMNS